MAKSLCDSCVALCCRYIALPIDNPKTASDYDNVRWYLMHENVVIFVDKKQWYIGFFAKCKNLQPNNMCGIYEVRPRICRSYETHNCDYHALDYNYDELFTSADQLREFAEKKLGKSMIAKTAKPRIKLTRQKNGKKKLRLPVLR